MSVTRKKRSPAPPVPADLDFRTLPYMPLFVDRLKRSRAWAQARSTPLLAYALINLWTAAWNEVPACSLPNDEDVLADRAGVDLKTWRRLCGKALYKFGIHSDGRLYHPELVEIAQKVIASREKERLKKRRQRSGKGQGNQEVESASPRRPGRCPGGLARDMAGDKALNIEHITKNKEHDVETPRASSTKDHEIKNHDGEDARATGPVFLRNMGSRRAMADAVGQRRAVTLPLAGGARAKGLKDQGRADLDMVEALIAEARSHGRALDQEAAWLIVLAARDPGDARHVECRQRCDALSRRHQLGWFGDESPVVPA